MYDIAACRGARGPAGHPVRREFAVGHAAHHHQQARSQGLRRRLRSRAQHGRRGRPGLPGGGLREPAADRRAAIRLVGWARHDAGYIDNVRSTRVYPSSGFATDNSKLVENDYNDTDTYGARAALRVDLNDNWTVTPTIMGQVQKADGGFGYDRTAGDLKVAHARPEFSDDRWGQAALTVEGRVANFDLVYAGAYMFRDVDSELDYRTTRTGTTNCSATARTGTTTTGDLDRRLPVHPGQGQLTRSRATRSA